MPSPPQTPVRSRNATHPEVIPDSPITGPETSRRLSHPVLLRGAFYAIGCAVTFGVITSLAKFTYDHGASPQTAVWSRILAPAVLMGGGMCFLPANENRSTRPLLPKKLRPRFRCWWSPSPLR